REPPREPRTPLPRVPRCCIGPVRERQEVPGIVGVPQEPCPAEPRGRLGALGDERLPPGDELVLAAGLHVPVPGCVLIPCHDHPFPDPPESPPPPGALRTPFKAGPARVGCAAE